MLEEHFLTEEQVMIRDLSRRIAEEKIVPIRAELDETGEFPHDIVKELAASDLFGVFIPEEYGGFGGGIKEMCIVTEELSRACGGIALAYAATGLGAFPILLYGNKEQKKKYLGQIAKGESLAAFGLTEPDAGSDAGAIKTRAKKVDGGYEITGNKIFITNGSEADIYTVVAVTDPTRGARGASTFIVEKGVDGFSFGKKEDKMGIRASVTSELVFEDCFVPEENLLGREGLGFMVAMKTFDQSRPGVAAQALGIAQGALDEAVKYARQREQFGKPVASFQGMKWMLADMATKLEAARSLVYRSAEYVDAGAKNVSKLSAMAKCYASDIAMEITTDAVQVLGGYGYMREYPVEKMMRDAKITQIYEGTNQIQRDIIATNLYKEYKNR
ncbi:MAG: acyl-CoA dehydrogenase family protein [Candidatus Zixiibacteriota bacterium]